MATTFATRLIICADGTWCTPDGPYGQCYNNISNIYRVYASVKVGECEDARGQIFNQQKVYYPGIGSKDNIAWIERLQTGVFGDECINQIREIYERCCLLSGHAEDEVWFYGFSRGAYVVRAVAGLLHYLRSLTSAGTPAFQADYAQALKLYKAMQKNSKLGSGQIHNYFSANTRAAPKIQFLGAFDTVKAVNDRSLYDISFNESIQHLRHALALNEDRKAFTPEYLFPDFNRNQLRTRSFVQAWFLGAHIDMGGSAAKDGLSLYPLQWMLLESKSIGLVLEFDGSFQSRANIDNPLNVGFPKDELHGKGADMWSCKVTNGLVVEMQDLRKVHDLPRYDSRYGIRLNKQNAVYWTKQSREPFNSDGEVQGYCSYAPQGTILHPSVYLIFDEYCHVLVDSKDLAYRKNIDQWRSTILPMESEFWNEHEVMSIEEPAAIRILVCGNTGVGKSSLINEVFGVPVTESSERKRGVHNVNEPFTTLDRPDLIIHDSGGFEAGGTIEMDDVKNFVTERSAATEIKGRLHLIWFCLELNSARTQQSATLKLFKIVSQYAKSVPIIVVATKKDEFMGVKVMEARKKIGSIGKDANEYFTALDEYAEAQFWERMKTVEKELVEIEAIDKLPTLTCVSPDDKESINLLTETTARCFDHEKVRLLYISAQVTRIDLKVDLAIAETMRLYRHTVRSAVAAAFIPTGSSIMQVTISAVICKTIVSCFGIPGVSSKTVQEIVNSVIWEDIGNKISVLCVDFLGVGIISAPIIVPVVARLFLMLACDVILILVGAFKDSTKKCIGQPLKEDIEGAACAYRQISKAVHKRIKKAIPRRNVVKSFQTNKVKTTFEEIIRKYKSLAMEGIEQGSILKVYDGESSDSDLTAVESSEKMEGLSINSKEYEV